jgi:HAD superfamily hydrolase (TIGR01490 family)
MTRPAGLAFYDFDGTLASCNVVTQYAFFARSLPRGASWKLARVVLQAPAWLAIDYFSREWFNAVFFREYREMQERWLRTVSPDMFERVVRPRLFSGARERVAADRAAGFRAVLVTGSIDAALGPVMEHFGFDDLIANRLEFRDGLATGRLLEPVIAGKRKVEAMRLLCERHGFPLAQAKAYSDSFSDLPMLEAVGDPVTVNPDRRLRRVARERGWPVLQWRASAEHPRSGEYNVGTSA